MTEQEYTQLPLRSSDAKYENMLRRMDFFSACRLLGQYHASDDQAAPIDNNDNLEGPEVYREAYFSHLKYLNREILFRDEFGEELVQECDGSCGWDCCQSPPSLLIAEEEPIQKALLEIGVEPDYTTLVKGTYPKLQKVNGFCVAFDQESGLCRIHENKPLQCQIMFCGKCRGVNDEYACTINRRQWHRVTPK